MLLAALLLLLLFWLLSYVLYILSIPLCAVLSSFVKECNNLPSTYSLINDVFPFITAAEATKCHIFNFYLKKQNKTEVNAVRAQWTWRALADVCPIQTKSPGTKIVLKKNCWKIITFSSLPFRCALHGPPLRNKILPQRHCWFIVHKCAAK